MTTMEERCNNLKLKTFDYAMPQEWVNSIVEKTGLYPRGIVWLYDEKAKTFGRPYAVSMYGYWILKLANIY